MISNKFKETAKSIKIIMPVIEKYNELRLWKDENTTINKYGQDIGKVGDFFAKFSCFKNGGLIDNSSIGIIENIRKESATSKFDKGLRADVVLANGRRNDFNLTELAIITENDYYHIKAFFNDERFNVPITIKKEEGYLIPGTLFSKTKDGRFLKLPLKETGSQRADLSFYNIPVPQVGDFVCFDFGSNKILYKETLYEVIEVQNYIYKLKAYKKELVDAKYVIRENVSESDIYRLSAVDLAYFKEFYKI